jgi:hypothetical protein
MIFFIHRFPTIVIIVVVVVVVIPKPKQLPPPPKKRRMPLNFLPDLSLPRTNPSKTRNNRKNGNLKRRELSSTAQ